MAGVDRGAAARTAPGAQARKLIGYASRARRAGTAVYPMYLFYNCDQGMPPDTSYPGHCAGVHVANGHVVARHIRRNIVGRSFPAAARRFVTLAPMMIPLPLLLCAFGATHVPRPIEVAALLEFDRERLRELAGELDIDTRAIPRPSLGDGVPEEVERLLLSAERGLDGDDDRPGRNTVVFLAGE